MLFLIYTALKDDQPSSNENIGIFFFKISFALTISVTILIYDLFCYKIHIERLSCFYQMRYEALALIMVNHYFHSNFFHSKFFFKRAIISDSKHFKTSLTSQQSFLWNSGFIIKNNSLGNFDNKTAINKGPYIPDWMSTFSSLQTWVSTIPYILPKSLTRSDEIN